MQKEAPIELLTSSYDYELPSHLIAQSPVQPRDNAKLLVYDRETNTTTHTTFKYLLDYLPKNCDVFLNDTKVIKARIFGKKQSGGKIELLFNKPLDANEYLVMTRGRVKIGTEIFFDQKLVATVVRFLEDGARVVTFKHQDRIIRFEELVIILEQIGHIPLPPYMLREENQDDEKDYQTLFAKN
ncbi:MAG TPA: tRNA preQ1(34) S-adenosylmethionine ribosyltransferase-isomerase QueA, partial [Sulfurovum sp.]|nr:tRNA preQ1(34) S-adenosylmethionine ribosyltransferase-isomerase QueA [Sulfurovum sp.]